MSVTLAQRDLTRLVQSVASPREGASDAHLLGRFHQQSDASAFADLMHRHGPLVYGVCRRILRDASDVDDAFQACFLVLLRKAAHLRHPAKLSNWLYGVALRTAWEMRSMKKRRQQREAAYQPNKTTQAPDHHEISTVLDEEIAQLPSHYREVVIACLLEGTSRREAARQFQIAEGTLSSRLAMAKKLLAKALQRRGVVVPVALLELYLTREAQAQVPTLLQAKALTLSSPSTTITSVAHAVLKTMLVRQLLGSTVLVALLALVLIAGFGAWSACAAEPKRETLAIELLPIEETRTAPGNLLGKVIDPHGTPVAGASVIFFEGKEKHATTTDVNGSFRLNKLPSLVNARYKLVVQSPDWAMTYVPSPRVFPQIDHDLGTIQLHPGRRITGQILDIDGKPRSKTVIDIFPLKFELGHTFNNIAESFRIETDNEGRYTTPPLPMSCIDLMVRVPERLLVQQHVELKPGLKPVEKNIKLEADTPYELKIVNDQGKPIAGASLDGLYGLEAPPSNKDGIIIIRGYAQMPSVLYRITAPGYPQSELIIQKQQTTVTLKKPTYLLGKVVDVETNEPVSLKSIGICQLKLEKGELKPFG